MQITNTYANVTRGRVPSSGVRVVRHIARNTLSIIVMVEVSFPALSPALHKDQPLDPTATR